jgi:hypothetical protein
VGSTGHLFVLAALLAVVAATRAGGLAALLACTSVLVRWGSPSLAAVGGAQAVLGPAVLVGTATAAATWLASLALVLSARDRLTAGAFGLAAAALAAGPSLPHALATKAVGAVVGVGAAYAATRLPRHASLAAVVLAAAAVVLAAAA